MHTPTRRTVTLAALALVCAATTAQAAASDAPQSVASAARATAQPAAAGGTAAKHATRPRTLEAIRIEGEIPVPQVLFITARDQRRFMDLHHRRYLLTSLEIGERTVFPAALVVVRTPVSGATRETNP